MDDVRLALCADADFAGCVDLLRSTSGGHLNIQGPNTRFPLSGSSNRQGCVTPTEWRLTSTPRRSMMDAHGNMHGLLSDPDTLKALTPTCDPIKGTMQTASGTVDGVPAFPYTHIPIMPPDLWWSGLTSKEGLHEHEGRSHRTLCSMTIIRPHDAPP